jgi:hypothetical protein
MISAETVTETWQRMSQMSVSAVPKLVETMRKEQPLVLGYLLALENFPFNQHEIRLDAFIDSLA